MAGFNVALGTKASAKEYILPELRQPLLPLWAVISNPLHLLVSISGNANEQKERSS
jgi:hypothetical protein